MVSVSREDLGKALYYTGERPRKKFFDTRILSSAFSETKGPKSPGNLCLGVQDTLLVPHSIIYRYPLIERHPLFSA